MGGHGGLNILPQKSWNVYNFDNREKVRLDEEAAAKEEQLKREQSRKRDAEFRLERLRQSRGLSTKPAEPTSSSSDDPKHINLFEALSTFPSLDARKPDNETPEEGSRKKQRKGDRKEGEVPRVILSEDEKYRLGYGLAGKGVKAPWYLVRPSSKVDEKDCSGAPSKEGSKKTGKKTLEELREERIQREKREKGRERELMIANRNGDRAGNAKVKGFSRRGP